MDENQQPTQFNMAIATLQRMDKVLTMVTHYATIGDLINWNIQIMELRREISPFIKEKEYQEIENIIGELNSVRWTIRDSIGNRKISNQHFQLVSKKLDEVTIKIYKSMKEAGILMPKSDDPRLAIRG
jgi:hypothetical protein